MEPLSPQARAHLAAFRRLESPERAVADRCLAALQQRLDEPIDLDDDPPARPRLAPQALAGLALAAGVLLALTWAVMRRSDGAQVHVAAPYHADADAPHAAEVLTRSGSTSPAPAPQPDAAPLTEPPAAPVAPDGPRPSKRPARGEDSVAAEVNLLRRARLAEPSARLELLEEHARRFPTGILAAERGLLEIEARCALGQRERARELAASYPKRFSGSPLVERAANLCRSDPP